MTNVFEFKQTKSASQNAPELRLTNTPQVELGDTAGGILARAVRVLDALARPDSVGMDNRLRTLTQDCSFELRRVLKNLPQAIHETPINDAYVQRERLMQAALAWCIEEVSPSNEVRLYKDDMQDFAERNTLELSETDNAFIFEVKQK